MSFKVISDNSGLAAYLGISNDLDNDDEMQYNTLLEDETKDAATLIFGTFMKRLDGDIVWTTPEIDAAVSGFQALVDLLRPSIRREYGETTATGGDNTDARSE